MDIKVDDSGLRKLRKNIENLKDLEHGKSVPIEELLTSEFMRRYTKSRNFEEFVLESGFVDPEKKIDKEIFQAIPDEDWDKYVSEQTSFASWHEMLEKAGKEYISSRLFKGLK